MSHSLRDELERVGELLASNGVHAPTGHLDRIRTAIGARDLGMLTPENPVALVQAHFTFLDARLDDVTTIVFYQAMSDLFAANFQSLKPAFAEVRMNAFKSRIVLSQKLASRYFHEGRRRVDDPATAASGVWLLRRCIDVSVDVVGRDDRATPSSLRIMHSQIATSYAHVARAMPVDEPARVALLRTGLHHSHAAEANGDLSEDHDGYQLELALRLHEAGGDTSDPSPLDVVDAAIMRARESKSSILQGAVGDVEFARASSELQAGHPERAVPLLMRASGRYDKAIAVHPQAESTVEAARGKRPEGPHGDIGYLFAKRGRCAMLLYWFATDASGRRDTVQLDRALADWSEPSSAGHRRDHELARILLARARLLTARGATADAQDTVRRAAVLVGSDTDGNGRRDPSSPRLVANTEGQGAGLDIETALDSGDVEAVARALASSAALAPDVPAPSGSMSKAVIWLKSRLDVSRWRPLGEMVLDRIEVDGAHGSLTMAAQGHVAGHAATVARAVLLRDDASEPDLVRVLELSRAHVANGATLSSSALDGASRAAFAAASRRVARTESMTEDELGVWLDALTWAVAALRAEQDVQSPTQSRIEAGDCARRIVRAATTLAERTGDRGYLDAAQHGVYLASSLVGDLELRSIEDELPSDSDASGEAPSVADRRTGTQSGAVRSSPVLHAWRALADVDREVGARRIELAQAAAAEFWSLSSDGDPILGGKLRTGARGVTTIPDTHGLASQLIVLKRTAKPAALREHAALSHLTAWLDEHRTPAFPDLLEWGWRVPEPLGVIELGDDAVLVMRRLPGKTLSHYALEFASGRGESPLRFYELAVDGLADFHSAMLDEPGRRPENMQASLRQGAAHLWGASVADDVSRMLAPLWLEGPQLPKKDAHAGNWLWSSAAGGLILIDVEGDSTRPVLAELSTVLDDLPLLPLDEPGWTHRIALAQRYLARLPERVRLSSAQVRPRLELAMLHNAAIGLSRSRRRDWGTSSRGIRFAQLQDAHYAATLAHLATHAVTEPVGQAAQLLRHDAAVLD